MPNMSQGLFLEYSSNSQLVLLLFLIFCFYIQMRENMQYQQDK